MRQVSDVTLSLSAHRCDRWGRFVVAKAVGGGTSAIAASSHAACPRFRGTDPLITGVSRRALAESLGLHGQFGTITTSRWARAMTFERMVHDAQHASEVATSTIGALELERPAAVIVVDAQVSADRTADLLTAAHERAVTSSVATLIHQLSVPFVGFEEDAATEVKPDFAVVAPAQDDPGHSWLIVGDVKDYERVRSRIDDARLLKGFLQVAVGAESLEAWTLLPAGMRIHSHGVLVVPRNSFLQPEARVELLADHRAEVRMRIDERRREAAATTYDGEAPIKEFVGHLLATFDPTDCRSCTLYAYCRQQLRDSSEPIDLLVEIGIPENERPDLLWVVDGGDSVGAPSRSALARVRATVEGVAQPTGQRRIDPAGAPGTVNVVIAKSDSTTLGVYGIAVQRIDTKGAGPWHVTVFDAPQSDEARRGIARAIGAELVAAMRDRRQAQSPTASEPDPVHLVVPDATTADVLTSIADHLAGAELSRLRWETDRTMGRPTLTFNGEPAQVPRQLSELERTGVSFLLEEDRARAFTLRSPVVNLQRALSHQLIPGGPESDSLRLDYLVAWASPDGAGASRHRRLGDAIEAQVHTPGALLAPARANDIHEAFVGNRPGEPRPAEPDEYHRLVRDELAYKIATVDAAITALVTFPTSRLAKAHRAIEADAQSVWRRRLLLHASDLVRFGRVARWWRNALVETVEADDKCRAQLTVLENPTAAVDMARDAGTREVFAGRVTSVSPLEIEVDSRRVEDGTRLVLLHLNGDPCVEHAGVDVSMLKGSIKITDLSIGPIRATERPRTWAWSPEVVPTVAVGDELIVADFAWFSQNIGNRALNVKRPTPDVTSSPKPACSYDSYEQDPDGHKYCCRPHEDIEAEWSNTLADRRARGELNPQTWPPVVDADGFEVTADGVPVGEPTADPVMAPPPFLTVDDVD